MQLRPVLLGLLFSSVLTSRLEAQPSDGQIVRGPNFEGVIFTPKMVQDSQAGRFSQEGGLWTPSRELVLKAEAALPAAIADKIKYPKPVRGPYYPTYYSTKNGTDLHLTKTSPKRPQPDIPDSEIEDNFLYDVVNYQVQYRRQYIGETINGKKVLLLSFIYRDDGTDKSLKEWRHQWIEVLGGGFYFWHVNYDPIIGRFSNWEGNADW